MPRWFDITVSGTTSGVFCHACVDYNGTWRIITAGSPCHAAKDWYSLNVDPCNFGDIILDITYDSGTNTGKITVSLCNSASYCTYEATQTGKYDCDAISGVTLSQVVGCIAGCSCPATISVTAVP